MTLISANPLKWGIFFPKARIRNRKTGWWSAVIQRESVAGDVAL